MQIAEMRSVLDLQNLRKGRPELPESTPDWVVQNIFERRNGISLTPLPQKTKTLSASDIVATSRIQRAKAIIQQHSAYLLLRHEASRRSAY